MNKVFVTGLGVISNVGVTLEEFWASLVAGKGKFSTSRLAPKLSYPVGAVDDTSYSDSLPLPTRDALDRNASFAIAATLRALDDAGISWPLEEAARAAVVLGNGAGGQETIESQYRRLLVEGKKSHPLTVARTMVSSCAS